LYVRDVALELLRRGHQPMAYSPQVGEVADELSSAGVEVVDDLDKLATSPDIIHGNQHVEMMTALLFHPRTPGIYFCHNSRNWLEAPPKFPRILRYVAVDDACYAQLIDHGIDSRQAEVILNFVDLRRFKPRNALPVRPRRALVFSNYAHAQSHLKVIREACKRAAIDLDVIGEGVGRVEARPELKLGQYDLIFAKARAALESMAVGAAVILCDASGSGPMVTENELESLRRLNFGIRTLRGPLNVEAIQDQIARYDPKDAQFVSQKIRDTASAEDAIGHIIHLYEEVFDEYRQRDVEGDLEEWRAAAQYVRRLHADFAFHSALTMRLRNRLLQLPILGPRLVALRERTKQRH
jgi:hypothetical protein